MKLKGKRVGFGVTGSHCTLEEIMPEIKRLVDEGADVVPIITNTVATTDTHFGKSEDWLKQIRDITGQEIIATMVDAEPLGPTNPLDIMVIAPMTGGSTSKLANALTDSPVLMAAKATMRTHKPVVLAISTNDGLGLNMANIAKLMASKDIYFVPFGQDFPDKKPKSLVARMELIKDTCEMALEGKQLQPVIVEKFKYMD
jgi:dipicolinate synthase subunit B